MRREQEAKKRETTESVKSQTLDEKSLNQLTVPVLKEKAKSLGIEGFDNMKKAMLVEVILKASKATKDPEGGGADDPTGKDENETGDILD